MTSMTPVAIPTPHPTTPQRLFGLMIALSLALPLIALAPASALAFEDPLRYTPRLDDGPLGPGRAAYRERRDEARALDAYRLFKEAVDANPDDATARWHLAMSCYYLGMRVLDDPADRERVYAEGRDMAATAVDQDPDCAPCHMLTAINHALWGQEVGIFRVLSGLPRVHRHLNRSMELDPAFAGAASLRALSQIAAVVPRWMGGGKKKARAYLQRAIEVSPREPLNYEFLADLLLDEYGDRDKALSVAKRGLQVPQPTAEYVESVDSMEWLERFVNKNESAAAAR
jgi:tetratricopeptide (TPR) repeat protein